MSLKTLLALFLLASTAWGQSPDVRLVIDTTTLELGESIDAKLVCTNTGAPTQPKLAMPEGLEVQLTNPAPSKFQQQSWINGRRSATVTYTYSLRVTATAVGTFSLGPFSVETDSATHMSNAVTITVRKSDSDRAQRGDQTFFAELTVEPESVFVSETVTATLTISMREVKIRGRSYKIDPLEVLDQRNSNLSVFTGNDKRADSQMALTDSTGQRHQYRTVRLTKTWRVQEIGPLSIGPVFLKFRYPTQLRRGIFGGLEMTNYRRETARADAVVVNVQGPPDAARPDSYEGAIGRFAMDVSAKPLNVERGQPVTLTIAIKGSPIEGIAGPDLSRQAELASRFEYAKDELVGDVRGNQKVFRRAVFPKQEGEQSIPPIEWSYFDPNDKKYVTLTSKPIPIVVNPSSSSQPVIAPLDAPGNEGTTLTVLRGGLSPNYISPAVVLVDQAFSWTHGWTVAVGFPPLASLSVILLTHRRRRLQNNVGLDRRRRAARKAGQKIKNLNMNNDTANTLASLADVLMHYIADRYNLPTDSLTPLDVHRAMQSNGTPERLVTDIVGFLEKCDAARYARLADNESAQFIDVVDKVKGWIDQLERGAPC